MWRLYVLWCFLTAFSSRRLKAWRNAPEQEMLGRDFKQNLERVEKPQHGKKRVCREADCNWAARTCLSLQRVAKFRKDCVCLRICYFNLFTCKTHMEKRKSHAALCKRFVGLYVVVHGSSSSRNQSYCSGQTKADQADQGKSGSVTETCQE